MSYVSKLGKLFAALLMFSLLIPSAQAGGLLDRLRSRICQAEAITACEQSCKCEYLANLAYCESVKCYISCQDYLQMKCKAKRRYVLCLQECRCGRTCTTNVSEIRHCTGGTPSDIGACIASCQNTYEACRRSGLSESQCLSMYWDCLKTNCSPPPAM
jgi:hypothetical protein